MSRDLAGKQIAHYHVLRQLGAGGMGEVYLAEDTNLGRKIALKVLHPGAASDPQRLARFRREATALASVNHPGIVTIYSVEESDGLEFITMELVEGRTLDGELGPLELDRFLEIAIQLADALSVAHSKGITHRDLKPGNIMITPNRTVKILDFGLAKLLEGSAEGADGTEVLTQAFQVMGTAGYMSPEQVRGDAVDPRSDIFSLGIILYEMATGRRPFDGKSSMDIASAILREVPTPPTELHPELPRQLGRIVNQCLEKDPDFRFQTARDIYNQLRELRNELKRDEILTSAVSVPTAAERKPGTWWGKGAIAAGVIVLAAAGILLYRGAVRPGGVGPKSAAAVSETPRIVILPFENLGSADHEYFAAGMTEEITSRLAMVDGLSVISRTTAANVDKNRTLREIGEELGVGYVLEGTVRWSEADDKSRVRVTPQLIRVSDDSHLWARTYDEVIEDVFEVQSSIAAAVIENLGVNLFGSDRASLDERPTASIPAYQAFLRARDWASKPFSEESVRMTAQMLERAVELDPDFGVAWAGLVQHQALIHFNGWDPAADRLGSAQAALENVKRLLPGDARTVLASGYYHYYGLTDYARALEAFERAARAMPNDTEILLAIGLILRRLGRMEDALGQLNAARVLDPQNVDLFDLLGETSQALRRYEDADAYWARALEISPDWSVLYVNRAGNELRWRGDFQAAREILKDDPDLGAGFLSWFRMDLLDLDLLDRDFDALLARLEASPQDDSVKEAKRFLVMGLAARLAGRAADAETYLGASRDLYEELLFLSPGLHRARSGLGLANAFLGNRETAIEEGRRAAEGDAADLFTGPQRQENLAAIYAWVGETDKALELLTDLLNRDYQRPVSPALLAIDPTWDPLRQDPRFQRLIEAP